MTTLGLRQRPKRAGVAIGAIRYRERNALLGPAGSMALRHCRDGDADIGHPHCIGRATALNFRVDQIRTLLTLSDDHSVAQMASCVQADSIRSAGRIKELEGIRWQLKAQLSAEPDLGRAPPCPTLNAQSSEHPQ